MTGLAAGIFVVIALSLPNICKAGALLALAESSGGGLSGLMTQYDGLSSLAGVSLPGGEEGSRTQLGMQLMKSRAFISVFVGLRYILPDLMAVESWDTGTEDIVFDPESNDAASKTWVCDVESPKVAKPSVQ